MGFVRDDGSGGRTESALSNGYDPSFALAALLACFYQRAELSEIPGWVVVHLGRTGRVKADGRVQAWRMTS